MSSFNVEVVVKPILTPIDVRTRASAYTSNSFLITSTYKQNMSQTTGGWQGMVSSDPQFDSEGQTLGFQNFQFYSDLNFSSSQRYVNLFIAANSSLVSTKDLTFNGGGSLGTLNVFGTPSGYSISTEANSIRITSTGQWSNLPAITVSSSSASIDSVTIANVSGDSDAFGVQAVAASAVPPAPPNCLQGNTLIVVDLEGNTTPIENLFSGDTILLCDPEGKVFEEKVRVFRSRGHASKPAFDVKGVTTSGIHLLLDRAENSCEKCGHGTSSLGPHSCSKSRRVHVEGYATFIARDIGKHFYLRSSTPWYHLVLPNHGYCFHLANGMLSEGLRHEVGSHSSDIVWAEVIA